MKKFVFAVLFLAFSAQAQTEWMGIKAGPSIVNLNGTLGGQKVQDPYNWRPDFHVGFAYRYDLEQSIVFKVDVLYARRGTKYGALVQNGNININLNYISVPLMGGFRLSDNVDVYLGLDVAYLLNASVSDNYNQLPTDGYKSFAVGPVLGMGYHAENGVFFEARYGFGATDIKDPVGTNGVTGIKDTNLYFDFSVGYYFSKNDL